MKKILIIDDDQGILEAVKAILEYGGFAVEITDNSEYLEGVSKEDLPSVVLLDLLLSGKDGKEIAKKIKSKDKTKNIPIIMLSAHSTAAEAAKEAGVEAFIPKPFDMNELLEVVNKFAKS